MQLSLYIGGVNPLIIDRALLAAASCADAGDEATVASLIAQDADVPAALLRRGSDRLEPRDSEPDDEGVRHAGLTYVGGVRRGGDRWLLVQTCAGNRLHVAGERLIYEGRRGALQARSNVVGAFFGALVDAGIDLRTIPVIEMASQEPLRPWWADHALPVAWLRPGQMQEDGILRLSEVALAHLGARPGDEVYLLRQDRGGVLILGESGLD